MSCAKHDPLWHNFEMMASKHGARISRFQENSFINESLTSKFLLLLIFVFLSTLVHEIPIWPFSPKLGLMTSPRESKLQYFEKVISETNSSIQSSIKYRFWSFYHSRYMIYSCRPFLPNLKIMTTTKKHSRILKK